MRYYIIAGEASGDLHGSNLMKGIYAEDPQAEIRFWGGDMMLSASKDAKGLVRHYREGAVMGFVEVLAKARKFLERFITNERRRCKAVKVPSISQAKGQEDFI